MENFGTRLSVDDIWKVVLFLKTIPSGSLQQSHVLSVDDYYQWHPTPQLLLYVKKHPVQDMQAYQGAQQGVDVTKADGTGIPDPFLGEAERVFPGLNYDDTIPLPGYGDVSLASRRGGHQEDLRRLPQHRLDRLRGAERLPGAA